MVICADAKPSIQAQRRIHPSAPPGPGHGQLVEHEYERKGSLATSTPGTSAAAACSDAASPRAGSSRSTGSSGR